jgi:hypothetical protein
LFSDDVLNNTLNDLPRQATKLLEQIKNYLKEKSKKDNIPIEKMIFKRKKIRENTSWSFAQIRNNFNLSDGYSELGFLNTILTPAQLKDKMQTVKSIK